MGFGNMTVSPSTRLQMTMSMSKPQRKGREMSTSMMWKLWQMEWKRSVAHMGMRKKAGVWGFLKKLKGFDLIASNRCGSKGRGRRIGRVIGGQRTNFQGNEKWFKFFILFAKCFISLTKVNASKRNKYIKRIITILVILEIVRCCRISPWK